MRLLVVLALLVALASARRTAELEEELNEMIEELLEDDTIKRGEGGNENVDNQAQSGQTYKHPYDADALQRQNAQVLHKEDNNGGNRKKRQTSCVWDTKPTCVAAATYRTADGSCNNLVNTNWGQAATPQQRFADVYYEDNYSTPRSSANAADTTLPLARQVSQTIHGDDSINDFTNAALTQMSVQWGQFLAHDLVSTPEAAADKACCWDDLDQTYKDAGIVQADLDKDAACLAIMLPRGERYFTSKSCLNFVRSMQVTPLDCSDSHKEQINSLTSWIDASNVYGSSVDYMNSLRSFSGGKLTVSDNDLLPHDVDGLNCVKDTADDVCFKAGDARANVSPGLMSTHAIWVREHNKIVSELATINPSWIDEKLFQEGRRIVGALMQHITYKEYLPTILGGDVRYIGDLKPSRKGQVDYYDQTTNPSISNEFATAAFRFGHSMLQSTFSRISDGFNEATDLSELYGRTKYVTEENGLGLDRMVNGLLKDAPENADDWYSVEVTNRLFETAPQNGGDLAARNIQRGRDHGLPSYNEMRVACGLTPASSGVFVSSEGGFVDMIESLPPKLNRVYTHPNDVEMYTGGVLELAVPNGVVGPLFACIIKKQFEALRNGDRFYYERPEAAGGFTETQTDAIKKMSLSRVLCRNTGITEVQTNAFAQPSDTQAQRVNNVVVDCTNTADLPDLDLQGWKE